MRNTGLEEAQAGIKIAERNINNIRYLLPSDKNGGMLALDCHFRSWAADDVIMFDKV